MKYICKLLENNDDNIVVEVQGVILNCFTNTGINFSAGDYFLAEINIYDDFEIKPCKSDKPSIKKETGYRYTITGILDIEKKGVDSVIFFNLDDLYDYGYLNNQMVDISVLRLDISEINLLVNEIKIAVTHSVKKLFDEHPNEDFYYISLITSGEAHSPILSAWSYQALHKLANNNKDEEYFIKWSYADSPYTNYKNDYFQKVEQIFNSRTTENMNETDSNSEFSLRIDAMIAAMQQADREGLFGSGESRLNLLINVEIMPPDETNVERAKKLNPKNSKILPIWIEEAGEE